MDKADFYSGVSEFLRRGKAALAKGPVALIFDEDGVEVQSTLDHHIRLGFEEVVLFTQNPSSAYPDVVHQVQYAVNDTGAVETAVNAVIEAASGIWMYYCFNAEYLFFPFRSTRSVTELLAFHSEERRESMLTYVVDLYAPDLGCDANAVSLKNAQVDKIGYYALARLDADNHNHPKERQLDFHGGLRWRFEEHVPKDKRKIDRIALFKSKEDLKLRSDHTFSDEEYNTYACPWHNNITAAICSFRTAKALRTNPGSRFQIDTFMWHNSVPFEWSSQQLMELGLMEPGQWF